MLAIAPELVHLDRLSSSDDPDRTADLVFRYTAPALSTNGVTGRPSEATVELGRHLLDRTIVGDRRSGRARPRRETPARRGTDPRARPASRPPALTTVHRPNRTRSTVHGHRQDHRSRTHPAGVGARRRRRAVRGRQLHRHHGPGEVEGRPDRPSPEPARRFRALHAARHGRSRPDDAERGRVRRGARPLDVARHAVGHALRVDGRRPQLRRSRAVRALHPLDPEEAARRGGRARLHAQPRRRARALRVRSRVARAHRRLPRADGAQRASSSRRRRTTSRPSSTRCRSSNRCRAT